MLISCNPTRDNVTDFQRTTTNINNNWLYLENNTENLDLAISQKKWIQINLPHTWNNLDATDSEPGYRRNASWYKKELEIPKINSNTIYELYFEGVNITSQIYVNNKKVGKHIGGYIGFSIDITNALIQGKNTILVRADNSYNPEVIPSQKSDFFIFGGITRDVWLKTKPNMHITNLKIITPEVSNKNASILATFNITNYTTSPSLKLKATLIDDENRTIATDSFKVTQASSEISFKNIENPKLWDIDHPNLYTLKIALIEGQLEKDIISERVGFRWFEFKDYGAFYLNGKRLLLRGTHRHEEHAGVGAAMSNIQHRKDMEQIKSMGANFVRLAHYPQDPEVYKACDELGLLVWDELPWCRGGVGNAQWKNNTKKILKEIITQNYNHPSIILWSLGNEIYWLPDFKDGDNTNKINDYLQELNDLAHNLDPTRKTAIRKYYDGAHIVDVFSPSIWSGWYSGSYKSYHKALDKYKKQYPHFLHAEYGGASHLGRHSETPITGDNLIKSDGWEEPIVQVKVANIAQIGDWSENYIVDLFDWHLRLTETDSSFVGNAQWAFKDFGTPLRPENDIPYINQKGLVDRDGNPKDAYYVFKSYWAQEPFVYIESHTWTERQGPKEKERTISVFSNCSAVTLYHNGEKLEQKIKDINKFPASGLTWNILFKAGQNELIAEGLSSENQVVSDTIHVNYRFTKNDRAKSIKLTSKKLNNGNYLVTAIAYDGNGLRCLDFEDRIYFQCMKGGTLLKYQGTPTGSNIIDMANGKASVEVIPDNTSKKINVMVLNQNFKGTYLEIEK
ncbi:glycoside hydrolase family 2 TIM barrel-domain containing protein [Flavivirga amylovorans]